MALEAIYINEDQKSPGSPTGRGKQTTAAPDAGDSSGFEKAGGDAVIAVELNFVKGSGYAVPAGHGGGLHTANVCHRSDDNVAAAHGTFDQNNFEFDGGAHGKLLGAKEKAARGADVARYEGDREVFGHLSHATKAQRQLEAGPRIFALFGIDADGVSWDSRKAADVVIG